MDNNWSYLQQECFTYDCINLRSGDGHFLEEIMLQAMAGLVAERNLVYYE